MLHKPLDLDGKVRAFLLAHTDIQPVYIFHQMKERVVGMSCYSLQMIAVSAIQVQTLGCRPLQYFLSKLIKPA